jgi:hypothetical protein
MSRNIVGIYNYCDRWCERCTFTSRCAVYVDESNLPSEEMDMQNKAFWDRIGKNFNLRFQLNHPRTLRHFYHPRKSWI